MISNKYHGKDNALLVEFDFVVDLDYALVQYFKEHCPKLVMPKAMNLSEFDLRFLLMYRPVLNPLCILNPMVNLDEYYSILTNTETRHELIESYSRPYDTFNLMLTYLEQASSVYISILCDDEFEANHIKKLNHNLNVTIDKRSDILALDYSSIMMRSFFNVLEYGQIGGKHLFIANTKYNMDKEYNDVPDVKLSYLYNNLLGNFIHLMDLYKDIKFRPDINLNNLEGESNDGNTE